MKTIPIKFLFLSILFFSNQINAAFNEDQPGRRAVLELRQLFENFRQKSDTLICDDNIKTQPEISSKVGGGDIEARKAIIDLRKRFINLQSKCGLAEKFVINLNDYSMTLTEDTELRRAILDMRQRLQALNEVVARNNSAPAVSDSQRQAIEQRERQVAIETERLAEERRRLDFEQNNLPSCQGSDVTRWNNCNGELTVKGETIYAGEWKNGKYDGKGSITLQSGEQFIGWFKNGNITGWGQYAFPKEFLNKNNLKYCSDTNKNNWDSCFGKRVYTDGDNYVGEWKDGKFHGVGLYTWRPMNHNYVGEWSNGMKNGKGIYTRKILNTKTMEITDRSQYVGEFKDNKYYGNGNLLNIKNGFIENLYTGEFKDNLKQGLGTLAFDDGRIWKGQWLNDEVHGKLVKYRSDGGIEEQGIYKQGKLINSIIIDPNFANYYTDQKSQRKNMEK
jgi:hypothetical protein